MQNAAAEMQGFVGEMVESLLSNRDVDPEQVRTALGVALLEGMEPRAVYEDALKEAARPTTWPPAPAFEAVEPPEMEADPTT